MNKEKNLTAEEMAEAYVKRQYPNGATKGLHVKTCAKYAYERGYIDASQKTSLNDREIKDLKKANER